MPPFAEEQIGLSTQLIGLLLLANAITNVIAQVPVARFAEGRRRVIMMCLAALLFVGACLLVVAAGTYTDIGYAALIAA
jgi:MFS family permease